MTQSITRLVTLLFVSILLMNGCGAYRTTLDVRLTEVKRPSDATNQYGDYTITNMTKSNKFKYTYEDELIHLIWFYSDNAMAFSLTNKTHHSIRIIWDDAVFVDDKLESHRVIHGGVPFLQKAAAQVPNVVVAGTTYKDLVVPADKVVYVSDKWRIAPIFPINLDQPVISFSFEAKMRAEAASKRYKNKRFQILLPLEIQGIVNDYLFHFVVADIVPLKAYSCIGGSIN